MYNISNCSKTSSYHAGIFGRGLQEPWDGGVQTPQQLRADRRLEEAVEVLAVGEAQEVAALTSGERDREHDGVQEQLHQLLALRRNTRQPRRCVVTHTLPRTDLLTERKGQLQHAVGERLHVHVQGRKRLPVFAGRNALIHRH